MGQDHLWMLLQWVQQASTPAITKGKANNGANSCRSGRGESFTGRVPGEAAKFVEGVETRLVLEEDSCGVGAF